MSLRPPHTNDPQFPLDTRTTPLLNINNNNSCRLKGEVPWKWVRVKVPIGSQRSRKTPMIFAGGECRSFGGETVDNSSATNCIANGGAAKH